MKYVIKIAASNGKPCYFAAWEGDPGRTLLLENAVKYEDIEKCLKKIRRLEKKYPNRSFSLGEIIDTTNMI